MSTTSASYKPSAFYFRKLLRAASTKEEAVEIALALIGEHEALREWVRAHEMVPPKWFVTPTERAAKAAGSVSYLSSKAPASATGA